MNRSLPVEPLSAREAFEAYYELTPEQHDKPLECFALIAAKFKQELKTVRGWAKKYQWSARKSERDKEVMDRVAARTIENAVETKMYYHQELTALVRLWFTTRLEDKDLSMATIMSMKPADVRALIELDMDIIHGKDINDILKGVKEDEKDAKESVKVLSTEELRSIVSIGDADAKNKPIASPSGPSGSGSA